VAEIFRCSKASLEGKARNILNTYNTNLLDTPQPIPVMEIMDEMFGLEFEYQYIRNNGRVLGETVFNTAYVPVYDEDYRQYELIQVKGNTVILDAHLLNNPNDARLRYTCAHELGHYVRHKAYYTAEDLTAAKGILDFISTNEDSSAEWQADYFASCFLMPKGVVKSAFYSARRQCVKDTAAALAGLFSVSKESMRYRLKEMGLTT
jgi:Zn-dependent peptidase ImmA (M78 family)